MSVKQAYRLHGPELQAPAQQEVVSLRCAGQAPVQGIAENVDCTGFGLSVVNNGADQPPRRSPSIRTGRRWPWMQRLFVSGSYPFQTAYSGATFFPAARNT